MKPKLDKYIREIPGVVIRSRHKFGDDPEVVFLMDNGRTAYTPIHSYGWRDISSEWDELVPEELPRFLVTPPAAFNEGFHDLLALAARHYLENNA